MGDKIVKLVLLLSKQRGAKYHFMLNEERKNLSMLLSMVLTM